MRILAVGDIVGESGVRKLKEELPRIKREENIDFVITNGENSAGGMGINERNFNDMLSAGTNVVTMGNHTWGKKDIFKFIDHPQLLRPANYPKGVVGKGLGIYECNGKKIAVMNFMGRVDINILTENPFYYGKRYGRRNKRTSRYNNNRLSCRSNSRENCYGKIFRWKNNCNIWYTYTCPNSR